MRDWMTKEMIQEFNKKKLSKNNLSSKKIDGRLEKEDIGEDGVQTTKGLKFAGKAVALSLNKP